MKSPPTSATNEDQLTFEQVFRQHYARVYGLLVRVTANAEDAEDLAQQVFLQLFRREPPIWQDPAAEGWLWRAASHAALNALRDGRRRREREERAFWPAEQLRTATEWGEDPAELMRRHARQESVRMALRQIKPQESALLLLRHAGLSYAAVAQALNLNPASVGTLLRRAEARFKEKYRD
ncbi:MAG: polymerase, sigma-24 subunit, subfamily [Chloroflexi bacterium]|nr:polymerase, sigma-24 subunit, subfamily [Chloroflexota bacterium]